MPTLVHAEEGGTFGAVWGHPEGDRSELVLIRDRPEVVGAVTHDAGWLPLATIDPARGEALVVRRLGGRAQLGRVGLGAAEAGFEPWLVGVSLRQRPLRVEGGVVVSRSLETLDRGSRLALERIELVWVVDGEPRSLGVREALLRWPLGRVEGAVLVLEVDDRGSSLVRVPLDRPDRRVVVVGPVEGLRDVSIADDALIFARTHERGRRFTVERVWGDGRTEVLVERARPHLAPLAFGRLVLWSDADGPFRGRLRVAGRDAEVLGLPDGAPIPLAASGARAVVRVQSPAGQRVFVVERAGGGLRVAAELGDGARIFDSVHAVEAP